MQTIVDVLNVHEHFECTEFFRSFVSVFKSLGFSNCFLMRDCRILLFFVTYVSFLVFFTLFFNVFGNVVERVEGV